MAAANDHYFTEEILFLIFSWLPVLSLLRCKSVCKLWNSIISNPQFIQTHLTNSHKQPSLLRFDRIGDVEDMSIYTPEHEIMRLNLPVFFKGMNNFTRSCNGLVCLADEYANVICLCNPSTRQFKVLPTPEIKSCGIIGLTLGFGFDFIGNDYKLLRIVPKKDLQNGLVLRMDMYSTNADSWKSIEAPEEVQCFQSLRFGTCVQAKNVLYLDGTDELLSFNLHTEVLGVYPYPRSVRRIRSYLLDYEGSVAMIFGSAKLGPSLWMLDDDCGKLSWAKKFYLEGASGMKWILLYWAFGLFIGFSYDDFGYMFYDNRKKETKKPCDLVGVSPAQPVVEYSVVKYTDSLVSLQGFKQLLLKGK